MKIVRFFAVMLFMVPMVANAASSEFMMAAQLLAAAKNADVQQVQILVNNGANINFVDSTGVSIVCTALMNNDVRAAQILQMYGADASKCDYQIKQYKNKNKTKGGGGLFSGLSSAQTISLAAAGAAGVVGGLFLLTDVFDPGNDNDSGIGGGNRPGDGTGGGGGTGGAVAQFKLPYGPAMPNADAELENYVANLNFYSPDDDSILAKNFDRMTDAYGQNYLLMMHGYAPLARGYLGMRTLRNSTTYEPLVIGDVNWFDAPVNGGKPVNVALVTDNGINSNGYAYGVDAKNSLTDTLIPWTTTNGTSVNNADNSMVSSKYFNNLITLGAGDATREQATTSEDNSLLSVFDLGTYGTVVNNAYAADVDDLLAKIVGGRTSGYANADFVGFMPNGQMTIFRTGNGQAFINTTNSGTGTYAETDDKLSEIVLFGQNMTVTMGDGNDFVASYTQTNEDGEEVITEYSGYIGTNGYLYIGNVAGGDINQAYEMTDGKLTLVKELADADYYNYKALRSGMELWTLGLGGGANLGAGRAAPDVLANASVIEPLHGANVETIEDVLSLDTLELRKAGLGALVNQYYDVVEDNYYPGTDAVAFYNNLGTSVKPLVLFSTGGAETNSSYTGRTESATFENAVPLLYGNAEHYFMSVVAVGLNGAGTAGTTNVSGFAPKGKYELAVWQDTNGTSDITTDDKFYKARMCGIAGTGSGNVDPWCFAAAGVTDEAAVSAAAGAAGVLKSAFPQLSNTQIFSLMALTADGPLLGTTTDGTAMTEENLISYLQSMYKLPNEIQFQVNNGDIDYLDAFAGVFGYGLINLERATTPGTQIYYYDGDSIVSDSGNAYWRSATNTMFRPSAVLNLAGETISAPFYDVLESVDGNIAMPRVWENEFAFGAMDKRGLYMGDVLGEMKTRRDNAQQTQIGDMRFSMAVSERAYNDNMNGLDNLSLGYTSGNWDFGASYQRYLTDGASRFSGMANPVLGLATNAVVSDVTYNYGRWNFGARAFSGAITDEGLLENDPTIASQYMPAKLGLMQGAQTEIGWANDRFAFNAAVGNANETNTLLGAYSDGLLNFGAGNTTYVDAMAQYSVNDMIDLTARATFARTMSDASGNFILGMTDINSNAFAIGANIGNFEFGISQPLAITDGTIKYAYAKYDVIEGADGKNTLNVVDTHIADLSLTPDERELRFVGTYRHKLGEFTDGAIGFIYRINPNHTDDFGNESVFMMKLTHRLGI